MLTLYHNVLIKFFVFYAELVNKNSPLNFYKSESLTSHGSMEKSRLISRETGKVPSSKINKYTKEH